MTKTSPTLLEELATIDAALLEDCATDQQEQRGQELVALANAAPRMLDALIETTGLLDASARNADRLGQPAFAAMLLTLLSVNRGIIAEATIHRDRASNAGRAARVRRTIEAYNHQYDMTGNVVDLLTDLQHYCNIAHAHDISHRTFDDLLETARSHFDAETNGGD
jgi:hypothetical protein